MFQFRLDEGIFVKCHLLSSPSADNSTSHWLHAPAHSFSKLTADGSPWVSLMANMWGPPLPFYVGQCSWELNTAHFAQAHHFAHYNDCPSPSYFDLVDHSKGIIISRNNSFLKDPRKMYFYFQWNSRLNAIWIKYLLALLGKVILVHSLTSSCFTNLYVYEDLWYTKINSFFFCISQKPK